MAKEPKEKPTSKPPQGKEWVYDDDIKSWVLKDKAAAPAGPAGGEPPEEQQKDLFGNPENGKFLCYTRLEVSVKEGLDKVAIFQPSKDKFIVLKDKCQGTGDSMPDAIREFKKAWKAAH